MNVGKIKNNIMGKNYSLEAETGKIFGKPTDRSFEVKVTTMPNGELKVDFKNTGFTPQEVVKILYDVREEIKKQR